MIRLPEFLFTEDARHLVAGILELAADERPDCHRAELDQLTLRRAARQLRKITTFEEK